MKSFERIKRQILDHLLRHLPASVEEADRDDGVDAFVDLYISEDPVFRMLPEEIPASWFAKLLVERPEMLDFDVVDLECDVHEALRWGVFGLIKEDLSPIIKERALECGMVAVPPKPEAPPPRIPIRRGLEGIVADLAAGNSKEKSEDAPSDIGFRP